MTGIKRRHSRLFIFLFALICIACAAAPLACGLVAGNGEADYNLLRIESLKNGLLNGIFPVRVNAEFFDGYGYGASMTVPDLFLYIPALLRLIGFDMVFSYHIFVFACICLTFITVYSCGKYLAKNRYVGLLAAALVVLSQYYTNALYYRANMGEILAFVFVPVVVKGMYDLICEDFRRPYVLFLGLVGLFFSHMPLFLITSGVCVFLCLIFLRRLIKSPGKLLQLFCVFVLTAAVTIGFWLPYIEQLTTTRFWFPWLNMDKITVSLGSLFSFSQTYAEGDFLIPAFGALLPLLCLIRIFVRQNKQNTIKLEISDSFLVLGLLCIWAASRYFPINIWWMVKGLGAPAALQLPVVVLFALAAALVLDVKFVKRKERSNAMIAALLVSIIVLFTGISGSPLSYGERDEDYFEDSYYTYPMPQTAIIPDGAEYSRFDHSGRVEFDDGSFSDITEKDGTNLTFEIGTEAHDFANVPLLYYHGYAAEFIAADGSVTPLEATWENKAHTLRVMLPQAPGTVHVWYAGTTIQLASLIISFVGAAGAVVWLIFVRKKESALAKVL